MKLNIQRILRVRSTILNNADQQTVQQPKGKRTQVLCLCKYWSTEVTWNHMLYGTKEELQIMVESIMEQIYLCNQRYMNTRRRMSLRSL